ncbi:dihydrodipicolinate reductase [Nocardioides anomalus]|uniref:Dihydrodipicolinate reductase n=1 Tax=Nocardioides anomalus TaxID=2712223 RepID=A0A6G6W991_9ACTN|nr:dihydrodipicolinate reductase [Nocardioides anomalus]QIG41717.1 dihydrodipicolinate reductase [Nocardioides anomalus]
MPDENTFYFPDPAAEPTDVVVWGTGNMGRAAIRAVVAHPALRLSAVLTGAPDKVGLDAGDVARLDRTLGVPLTSEVDAALAGAGAVAYTASGDVRPEAALADVRRALASGAVVVTPSVYALYDPRSAPAALVDPLREACRAGGSALFVSGVDPGWGNDVLPVLVSALAGEVEQVRCREVFDYSTYDAAEAVRLLVGMGESMSYEPPMVAPGVPTMVWGGQVRLVARALGVELDAIEESLERRPLEADVTTALGLFAAGTQGALRFEVRGVVDGVPRIVVEHVTRIAPGVAADWPVPPDGGAGAHTVLIEGRPRIEVSLEATDEPVDGVGNRAAGGNATAANRLVNAIPWLRAAEPGVYDGLDVPLSPAVGRLTGSSRKAPA